MQYHRDIDSIIHNAKEFASPSIVTILPTYTCTAACKECCFESSPKVKGRLSLDEIKKYIDNVIDTFPKLKVIVFSGGECFTLGNDLFEAISYIKRRKPSIAVRCVTNAYWGRSLKKCNEIVSSLLSSGVDEINISTGLDHQEWVDLNSVMNAAKSILSCNIKLLITIESDTEESSCFEEFVQHEYFELLTKNKNFTFQINSWMPFHDDSISRKRELSIKDLDKGCDQLMNNLVLTPHGRVSACCGLTFEHIPEMIIGNAAEKNYDDFIYRQLDDFLKLWIKVDGPLKILKDVYGNDEDIASAIDDIQHQCHACVLLHQKDKSEGRIKDYIHTTDVVENTLNKINIRSAISKNQGF